MIEETPDPRAARPTDVRDVRPAARGHVVLGSLGRLSLLAPVARHGVAIAVALAATLARFALVPALGTESSYLFLFPASLLVALLAGPAPGIVAGIAGTIATEAWLARATGAVQVSGVDVARLAILVLGAAVVGRAGARLRRVAGELEASRARAEASEAILAHAGEMARLGAWWVDLDGVEALDAVPVRWSEEVFRIFGYASGEVLPSYPMYLDHIPPDDRAKVVAGVAGALSEGKSCALEHRIVRKDGTVRFVSARAGVVVAEDGRPLRLVGAVQDVTERREAEQSLRDNEARFRAITEAMPQIVCVLAPDGAAEYVNEQWTVYSGLTLAETARAGWQGLLHPDDVPAAAACRRRALETRAPQEVELRYRSADGRFRWFLSRLAPMPGADGRVARFIGAAMDITARKEAEEALRDADRRKTEFLGMLSHELRNPLAPIRNAIFVLERTDPAGAQARHARAVIERQSEHLTRLVDDLLDVTRIARGKIELRRARVDLGEVLRRSGEDLRSIVEGRGLELALDVPREPILADADATRLGQVIGNLLQNAAKFTPRGGRVTLALARDGDEAVIRVRDTGIGIDPDLLERAFEPFVQGERSLARTQGGLGLGLALVKGVAELHGGSAKALSAGQGRGTEIVVRLPAPAVRAPQAPGPELPRPTRPKHVLVVDDNVDAAESLAELVELLGHTAEIAYDGPSAIATAHATHPSAVLCDLGLPGLSGYDVARALRAAPGPRVQLIAVSGYAQPDDVERATRAGFDAHVAKPPDPDAIERLLA